MVDPMEVITNIGQKALSVPTDILNVGTRRVTEDVGMMTAKVQELGMALVPPAGLGLPELPPLPGMPGAAEAPAVPRSNGLKPTKKISYLKV